MKIYVASWVSDNTHLQPGYWTSFDKIIEFVEEQIHNAEGFGNTLSESEKKITWKKLDWWLCEGGNNVWSAKANWMYNKDHWEIQELICVDDWPINTEEDN